MELYRTDTKLLTRMKQAQGSLTGYALVTDTHVCSCAGFRQSDVDYALENPQRIHRLCLPPAHLLLPHTSITLTFSIVRLLLHLLLPGIQEGSLPATLVDLLMAAHICLGIGNIGGFHTKHFRFTHNHISNLICAVYS